jgi:dethiobiotin synthetase
MKGLFISGASTGVGKTFVTRALASALKSQGRRVAAIKPVETGMKDEESSDAAALARACGRPEAAHDPGFYRGKLAISPYAATLEGEPAPPPIRTLVDAVHRASRGSELTLVEGAGGLLVPLDRHVTMAELAAALGLPVLIVAPNSLGVLSTVLCAAESARERSLELRAVVLVDGEGPDVDPSVHTNARILDERLGTPVFEFPRTADSDEALANAAISSGLLAALLDAR